MVGPAAHASPTVARRHVANVRLALVEQLDLLGVVVEPGDAEALVRKLRDERQPDVADADDDHPRAFLGQSLK